MAAASRACGLRRAGHEQLQVVVDLGDRADCRAGGLDAVALLDGDRGGNSLNGLRLRLVHAVEELPCVGAERLDVATLPLGIDRIEGETRLTRPTGACEDDERPCGKVEVDALEIILRDAAKAYPVLVGHRSGRGEGRYIRRNLRGIPVATRALEILCSQENALAHYLAGLELHRGTRRNRHVDVWLVRVPADPGTSQAYLKHSEVTKLHAVSLGEGIGDVIERALDDIEDIALDESGLVADGNDEVAFGQVGHDEEVKG